MKRIAIIFVICLFIIVMFFKGGDKMDKFDENSTVGEVKSYKSFKGYGDLIFPKDINIPSYVTLNKLDNYYPWYDLNTSETVDVVNYLKDMADDGEDVFYDIYTKEEMAKDPSKKNTGVFYFRGKENNKFALVSAGGGFMYVGAMKDSFPQAMELSRRGYNAFALIYRPDSNKACEDLARAIVFIFKHKDVLKVDTDDYSLWGGSAGARMTDWVGTYGTSYFGEDDYTKPSAIVMQYTGLSGVTGDEPATYANVGTNDSIASYKVMQERIDKIKANGTNAEIEVFEGLNHGFGTARGTKYYGWIDNAIRFWEAQ